jgi:hypothetical protein
LGSDTNLETLVRHVQIGALLLALLVPGTVAAQRNAATMIASATVIAHPANLTPLARSGAAALEHGGRLAPERAARRAGGRQLHLARDADAGAGRRWPRASGSAPGDGRWQRPETPRDTASTPSPAPWP